MGILTVEGMAAIQIAKRDRKLALENLISTPFNRNNIQQMNAIREFNTNFEFNLNQMYLFQGMHSAINTWGGSWLLGCLLPIPEFVNHFLTLFLYCGVAGYVLEKFSADDFYNRLAEMKIIYNWCLKKGNEHYNGADNTDILSESEIQRMIKLIAPLCTTDFMLTWTPITESDEPKGSLNKAISFAYSLFNSKPNVELNRLNDLKTSVERRGLDIGVLKGCEESIRYFATNPHFRELLMAKVRHTGDSIKDILPSVWSFAHSKSR